MIPRDVAVSEDRIWEAAGIALSEYPAGWLLSWLLDNSLIVPRATVDGLSPDNKMPPPKPSEIDTTVINHGNAGRRIPRGPG
jgi:hypothetical protein